VLAALAGVGAPALSAEVRVDRDRALVGDQVTVSLDLRAATRVERLEVLLVIPPGMEGPDGASRTWAVAVALAAGEQRTLEVAVTCRRWGAYWLGDVHLRAHDRFRLFSWERHLDRHTPLKVFPVPEALRALVRPFETQVSTGSHIAAARGDGIEFADLRPFLPGDRPRSINWRATARRGALMVNQRHPERATDVVLFLDSLLDGRRAAPRPPGPGRGRRRLAGLGLPAPAGPGGAGQLRRVRAVAPARQRPGRPLPVARHPDGDPGVRHRGLEGDPASAVADPAGQGPDRRPDPAGRRARGRRPVRPAGPGLRPGRGRHLPPDPRRRGHRRVGRAGPAPVGPGARDPAPPLPAPGRGRGRVARRHAPAAGAPGGGGMPAPRRARTRLACGLAATAVAAVLALAPLASVEGPLRQALAWLAAAGLLLAAGAALRLTSLLAPALLVLLAED